MDLKGPKPLPRGTAFPGVDVVAISAFLDALEAAPDVEPHSMMLLQHGRVVAEGWWSPYSADHVHLLYSLSKSFTSSALGFAVAEGLVDLDATVLSYFPEIDPDVTDPRSRSILVRHVAAMASGHLEETLERARAIDPLDVVRGFLLIPPDEQPGTVFAYNQPCTFAVAAIVQRVSGQSLTEFLRPRLYDPLGIGDTGWWRDASGREIGYSGLHATTEAVAKLGQLYLQGGAWDGRQLLPGDWVREATRSHIDNSMEEEPDWRQGYGFQFWMARHGYRGDGAYGQFCVVLPEYDAVLAMTGQSPDMQAVLDAAWSHLLPALAGAQPALGQDAVAALSARLAGLTLPPADGGSAPVGTESRSFVAADGNDQPGLTEVVLSGAPGSGDGHWTITLVEGESRIDAGLGIGEWVVTGVLATSGGWLGPALDADLRVDVIFLQTPHRLRLRCRADGTFTSRWVTPPLDPLPLAQLRMPADPEGPDGPEARDGPEGKPSLAGMPS